MDIKLNLSYYASIIYYAQNYAGVISLGLGIAMEFMGYLNEDA